MNTSDTAQPADTTPQVDEARQDQQPQDEKPQGENPQGENPQGGYRPPFDYHGGAQLYRPYEGRMVAGVAAGIAQYLAVDPTIVRIVLAVLTVAGGAGIPLYVAGWLLMPEEGAPQSLASEFIGSFQGRSY